MDNHPDGKRGRTSRLTETLERLPALPNAVAKPRWGGASVTGLARCVERRQRERSTGAWRLRSGYGVDRWPFVFGYRAFHRGRHASPAFLCAFEGQGFMEGIGACPNEMLAPADIKEPLFSSELKDRPQVSVPEVYEYDVQTRPGKTYKFRAG